MPISEIITRKPNIRPGLRTMPSTQQALSKGKQSTMDLMTIKESYQKKKLPSSVMLILSKEEKFANDSSAINRNGLKLSLTLMLFSVPLASWWARLSGRWGCSLPSITQAISLKNTKLCSCSFSHISTIKTFMVFQSQFWWEKLNSFISQWKRIMSFEDTTAECFLSESRRGKKAGLLPSSVALWNL